MKADRLTYYRFNHEDSLYQLAGLFELIDKNPDQLKASEDIFYQSISQLVALCISHGFYGNVWHLAITNFLVNHENAYSLSCEMTGDNLTGSISGIALRDFTILYELFQLKLDTFKAYFDYDYSSLANFDAKENKGYKFNSRIRDRIIELNASLEAALDPKTFKSAVAEFYREYGVGKLGLHKAFRIEEGGVIVPVTNITHVKLDDLIGYEIQKQELVANTESFLAGKKANNALLFGDAGTGKSTSIKAICNEYYKDGLRLIEIYKHQLHDIHHVISQIKSRKYKFIIYMDDLSFEEFETEYKYLKAVIEGGLEKKPDNVLIYATSNRRHLIRESFNDKSDTDDLHKNDTVQEKLSLSYRFGCKIYYGSPSKKEFNQIVVGLKDRYKVNMADKDLLAEANKWELSHGGLSGRCAQQFIDYILGQQ